MSAHCTLGCRTPGPLGSRSGPPVHSSTPPPPPTLLWELDRSVGCWRRCAQDPRSETPASPVGFPLLPSEAQGVGARLPTRVSARGDSPQRVVLAPRSRPPRALSLNRSPRGVAGGGGRRSLLELVVLQHRSGCRPTTVHGPRGPSEQHPTQLRPGRPRPGCLHADVYSSLVSPENTSPTRLQLSFNNEVRPCPSLNRVEPHALETDGLCSQTRTRRSPHRATSSLTKGRAARGQGGRPAPRHSAWPPSPDARPAGTFWSGHRDRTKR